MTYTVTIEPGGQQIPVRAGQTLLEALQEAGISLPADCGGQGLCRHCLVLLVQGDVAAVQPGRWLERVEDGQRWILACQARLLSDAVIGLSAQALAGDMTVLGTFQSGPAHKQAFADKWPLVRACALTLPPPTSDNTTADWQRLEQKLTETMPEAAPFTTSAAVLQELPRILRDSGYAIQALVADRGVFREIIAVGAAEPKKNGPLGLAVDVGTSTVVVQIVDLENGYLRGQASSTNAQKAYGADVISRIVWAEEHPQGPQHMQRLLVEQIGSLAEQACELSGCQSKDIVAASLAGNTTMLTFIVGAYPGPIRRDPHIPLARDFPVCQAQELNLPLSPRAPVLLAPTVSGFVGGDITAGVLATGLAETDELSLLVDVGTNGEIVLGQRDWLICCSCSAGPAFEGVDIEAGVHAVPGAIDRLEYDAAQHIFHWQTIGGREPIGLCGTGLLEALAVMFRAGLLDRQGHLLPHHQLVREYEDGLEVVIVPREASGTGEDIVLRDYEIENLLRSKAAIYAGISSLLKALELQPQDIKRLYLAGAFGNRLRVEEAVTIGMLPDIPRERIVFAGNTSLAGAYLALLSRKAREKLAAIARQMTYLELSTRVDFMEEFMAALFLPHTDLNRFPSQQGMPRISL